MSLQNTRGTALLICLFALLLLTLVGGLTLSIAQMDMKAALYQQQETAALYLSEAGIHLMFYWLEHSESMPISTQNLFRSSFVPAVDAPSRPFSGNPITLDIRLGTSQNQGIWDSSWAALWKALGTAGDGLTLKLYGPLLPGAIGTLESTAITAAGVRKTLTVQLIQKGPHLGPMKGSWHEIYE
jgi:Tfp pilus assembly protein PilX